MQLYAKNRYRFLKPDAELLKRPGVDAAQILGKQTEFKEAFFELEPETFQEAPEWIKADPMFDMAVQDGDIKIVQSGSDTSIPPAPEPVKEKAEEEKPEPKVILPKSDPAAVKPKKG